MLEIIILSITQGITEFLPISSSAHLILISKYFNFNNENLTLDISLHLGSLLAVMIFFKDKILNFFKNKFLFIKIIFGSLPTIIVGYLLIKLNLIDQLRDIRIIAFTTILFGVLLYFSDKSKNTKKISNDFNFKACLYIGLFQVLSLIPGVSRSGITITGARFINFDRVESAKISFLYSIPILSIVGSYSFLKVLEIKNFEITVHNTSGMFLSFIFSLITLKFFINFIKKFSLSFFVFYRLILGTIILYYVYKI